MKKVERQIIRAVTRMQAEIDASVDMNADEALLGLLEFLVEELEIVDEAGFRLCYSVATGYERPKEWFER